MPRPLTLSNAPPDHPALDFDFLRQEGIAHIERLAGHRWTDYNLHDPGITILEQLCYALTDLAYRIDYDMEDLLASGQEDPYRSLYSPAQVLTTHPVTLTDFRKVVIDVPGVKNAWLEPVETPEPAVFYDPAEHSLSLEDAPHRERLPMRGVYRVLIEADESEIERFRVSNEYAIGDDVRAAVTTWDEVLAAVGAEVSRRLHAHRNLCEDLEPPTILLRQGVTVHASVEIGEVKDPDQLLAEIHHALARFISPRIRFYTLAERIERGKRIDEIFDGPVLQHGFIDTDELEGFEKKTALRTSDLIQEIMNLDGVVTVRDIHISLADASKSGEWYLELNPNSTPFLDIDTSLFDKEGAHIQLVRGLVVARPDLFRTKTIYNDLQDTAGYQVLPEAQRDIQLVPGRDRNVGRYHSLQHHFPRVYGIGENGLPPSASDQRKAQARQLTAYLTFFDQLLANYFAQLDHLPALFSFYDTEPRTYFSQVLEDDRLGLEEIRIHQDAAAHQDVLETIMEYPQAAFEAITEDPSVDLETWQPAEGQVDDGRKYERKNRFLNHLLARFAEEFTDYSLLVYARISPEKLIEDKCNFLQDYIEVGGGRGQAFDYTRPVWQTEDPVNVSGLEKRISRKLGLSSYHKQKLADLDADHEGGFHLVEHILLRPLPADEAQWKDATRALWQAAALLAAPLRNDPYSAQVSFVFPDWIEGFSDTDFREFVQQTLREETPAHLSIHLNWLDQEAMRAFEAAYDDWLESLRASWQWIHPT